MASGADVATGPRRRADVARGSTAPLRRGAEATWQVVLRRVSGRVARAGTNYFVLPCGTMSHTALILAGDVAAWRASDRIRRR